LEQQQVLLMELQVAEGLLEELDPDLELAEAELEAV
jgi:hypothetical protein